MRSVHDLHLAHKLVLAADARSYKGDVMKTIGLIITSYLGKEETQRRMEELDKNIKDLEWSDDAAMCYSDEIHVFIDGPQESLDIIAGMIDNKRNPSFTYRRIYETYMIKEPVDGAKIVHLIKEAGGYKLYEIS